MPIVLVFGYGLATVLFGAIVFVFTYVFEWGFLGICCATALNNVLRFVLCYGYIACKDSEVLVAARRVSLFSRSTVQNLWYQIKLGTQTTLCMMPSLLVMDLNMFMATQVENEDGIIAAQTILKNCATIIALLPFSFSCSSSFHIGKAIGNDSKDAILKQLSVVTIE